jgi:hypothetical protein
MFRAGAQQFEIYRLGECQDCRPIVRLQDRFAARQWLEQFKGNAVAMNALRHMLLRDLSLSWRLDRATDDEVIEESAQLLGCGIWHVHEPVTIRRADTQGLRADSGAGAGSRDKDDSDQQSAPAQRPPRLPDPVPTKLSWIEIRLVDSTGKPVPGAAYEVIMPDGAIRSGKLNGKGSARYDQIPAGQCQVRFPKLDAKEWREV